MMGGCSATTDYFSDSKSNELQSKIESIEKLISNPEETIAFYDSTYTETTVKIMGASVKLYTVQYHFSVDGSTYHGHADVTDLPKEPVIKVKYLGADPSVNSVDPEKDLSTLESSKESKASLYFGIVFLAAGFFNMFTAVKGIRQRKRDEEAETLKSIAEFNQRQSQS